MIFCFPVNINYNKCIQYEKSLIKLTKTVLSVSQIIFRIQTIEYKMEFELKICSLEEKFSNLLNLFELTINEKKNRNFE